MSWSVILKYSLSPYKSINSTKTCCTESAIEFCVSLAHHIRNFSRIARIKIYLATLCVRPPPLPPKKALIRLCFHIGSYILAKRISHDFVVFSIFHIYLYRYNVIRYLIFIVAYFGQFINTRNLC